MSPSIEGEARRPPDFWDLLPMPQTVDL